jgi:acyl carrier protein/acyl-CoA thioesterase FadM
MRTLLVPASLQRAVSEVKPEAGSLVLDPGKDDDASLLRNIIGLGSDLVGSSVDPKKSLFENGLHSLRAVELVGKLNQAYGVTLNPAQLSAGEDSFSAVAAALRSAIDARCAAGANQPRFAHVDHEALQRIVDARLTGAEAPGIGSEHQRSALAEAARGVIYMIRRGFLKYLRIQYRDGLFHFLLSTPTAIDLERTVVIPGTRVHFEQTDYNRHFTVREIVRDSERGFYNLVHASGLAHLEHYFRVMFFASRLEARFDAELLEGEPYEMRCKVAHITGPLVDAEVAFYSLRKPDTQAFVVTWRLMLVIDPQRKLMYDFERGGAFGDGDAATDVADMPPSPAKQPKKPETWTLTRRGKFITSGSIAFFGVLIGLYAMAPVAVRILIPLPLAVAEVLKDLKPREAVLIFAMVGFWLRTHPGRKPLDGPVDMLLPHG